MKDKEARDRIRNLERRFRALINSLDIKIDVTKRFYCPICGEADQLIREKEHIFCPKCMITFKKVKK